jgi:kumamolisin
MATPKNLVPIRGSERAAVVGARVVGAPRPDARLEVTVVVRRRPSAEKFAPAESLGSRLPSQRKHLKRAEFAARHGANPDDVAKIEEFARQNNLTVKETNLARRSIKLSGKASDLSSAFGVELLHYEHPDGSYRSRVGAIYVPRELADIVLGVFGFTNRPVARPHYRLRKAKQGKAVARAEGIAYTPLQVAQLYDFPKGVDGTGQAIALIELDTPNDPSQPDSAGAGFSTDDLKAYFAQLGIAAPKVSVVSVDGGQNLPGVNPGADGEVTLDIEVAGAVAPGATIVVYFAPNTDQGFLDAVTTAIHDAANSPSVVSISWGGPEGEPVQGLQAFDQALQDAVALGVTVCCASGDGGSSDGLDDGRAHADFPASSPHALACGGTRLLGSNGAITSEVVWNDGANGGATGGGISEFFPLPAWQASANIPPSVNPGGYQGRGLPDVAGDADPETGYQVLLAGQQVVVGGTSAVAPLWAGLIARINQSLGKPVGFINPLLYGQVYQADAFHDITQGSNDSTGNIGAYEAATGWDPCTGLGSPDGAAITRALTGVTAAR